MVKKAINALPQSWSCAPYPVGGWGPAPAGGGGGAPTNEGVLSPIKLKCHHTIKKDRGEILPVIESSDSRLVAKAGLVGDQGKLGFGCRCTGFTK